MTATWRSAPPGRANSAPRCGSPGGTNPGGGPPGRTTSVPGGGPGRTLSARGCGPMPGLITCAPGGWPIGPRGEMNGLPGSGRPPGCCCGDGCPRSSCCAVARLDSAIDKTAGQISLIAKPANRRCKIARISESQGFANAIKSLQLVESGRACFPVVHGRYKRWEVGGGRATRQPGQVRKEAALTSAVRVARQPPTHCFAAPRLRRHFGANAAEPAGCNLNGKTGQQAGGSCTASRLCCRPASAYALAPAAQDRRAALSPRRVFRVRIARP